MEAIADLEIIIRARDEAKAVLDQHENTLMGFGKTAAVAGLAIAGGLAAGAAAALKMASDFDDAMRQVETQGGITEAQMESMKEGVLAISRDTGTAATDLAKALMPIAAEGYKGADGLKVLGIAAIGAKTFNADLMTTTSALTTVMKDYNFNAGQSQHVMDMLGKAVSEGRTSFQDLGGSLSTVAPLAANLGVNLAGLLGNLVSMTSQGIDADTATTNLKFTLTSLIKPTGAATSALKDMHLSSTDLANALHSGPQGLTNAFNMIVTAAGKEFPNSTTKATAAIAEVVGGARGLSAILATTGTHLKDTMDATAGLAHASDGAGYTMDKWADVQKDLSTQLDKMWTSIQSVGIEIGEKLIPIVSQLMGWLGDQLPRAVSYLTGLWTDHQGQIEAITKGIEDFVTTAATDLWKILQAIVPYVEALAKAIGTDLLLAFQTIKQIIADHFDQLKALAVLLGGAVVLAVRGLTTAFNLLHPVIQFVADHLNLLVGVLAIVAARMIAMKAIDLVTWGAQIVTKLVEMTTQFAVMAGDQGILRATNALLGFGGNGGAIQSILPNLSKAKQAIADAGTAMSGIDTAAVSAGKSVAAMEPQIVGPISSMLPGMRNAASGMRDMEAAAATAGPAMAGVGAEAKGATASLGGLGAAGGPITGVLALGAAIVALGTDAGGIRTSIKNAIWGQDTQAALNDANTAIYQLKGSLVELAVSGQHTGDALMPLSQALGAFQQKMGDTGDLDKFASAMLTSGSVMAQVQAGTLSVTDALYQLGSKGLPEATAAANAANQQIMQGFEQSAQAGRISWSDALTQMATDPRIQDWVQHDASAAALIAATHDRMVSEMIAAQLRLGQNLLAGEGQVRQAYIDTALAQGKNAQQANAYANTMIAAYESMNPSIAQAKARVHEVAGALGLSESAVNALGADWVNQMWNMINAAHQAAAAAAALHAAIGSSGGSTLGPHFGEGGIVTQRTVATVGEAGEKEWIIPQHKAQGMDALLDALLGVGHMPTGVAAAGATPSAAIRPTTPNSGGIVISSTPVNIVVDGRVLMQAVIRHQAATGRQLGIALGGNSAAR